MSLAGHETCHHRTYYLDCAAFDALLGRANGACEICGAAASAQYNGKLVIDHDHAHGWGAVRGLLCSRCNAHMRRIDSYERPLDEAVTSYLALGRGPWDQAKTTAKNRGETLTAVIEQALRRYIARHRGE